MVKNAKQPTWKQRAEAAKQRADEATAAAVHYRRLSEEWRLRAQERDNEIVALRSQITRDPQPQVATDTED